ncbi:MAG: hypothetical protein EOO41_04935, partial [Methanobacteriota archaeon]
MRSPSCCDTPRRQPQPANNTTCGAASTALSARANTVGAVAQRVRESQCINASLTTLGMVIAALAASGAASSATAGPRTHVPYRDSLLTHALSDCLGAGGKTVLLCTVSPAVTDAHETLSTLNFASRARAIKARIVSCVSTTVQAPVPESCGTATPSISLPGALRTGSKRRAHPVPGVLPTPVLPRRYGTATQEGDIDSETLLPARDPAPELSTTELLSQLVTVQCELRAALQRAVAAEQRVQELERGGATCPSASLRFDDHDQVDGMAAHVEQACTSSPPGAKRARLSEPSALSDVSVEACSIHSPAQSVSNENEVVPCLYDPVAPPTVVVLSLKRRRDGAFRSSHGGGRSSVLAVCAHPPHGTPAAVSESACPPPLNRGIA